MQKQPQVNSDRCRICGTDNDLLMKLLGQDRCGDCIRGKYNKIIKEGAKNEQ